MKNILNLLTINILFQINNFQKLFSYCYEGLTFEGDNTLVLLITNLKNEANSKNK